MIPFDDLSKFSFLRGVSPITQTNSSAALVGQIIDMTDLMSLLFAIMIGTWTDADATSTVLVEHGDDPALSDAAAVPDAELLPSGTGQEAAAAPIFSDDNVVRTIGYAGTKRYVRLTFTPVNNDAGALPIAILAIGKKRLQGTLN
jgi:hypothetical protein